MLVEVACFNLQDALVAQGTGADRIEFCENYSAGGITPSETDIKAASQKIKIPLFIMIRPRAGNYVYTAEEFVKMKKQILFCKLFKCAGVVFGILNSKNEINKELCRELVEFAKPMECTFHRAFDEAVDMHKALEDVIDCGFNRILTSGGKGKAIDNFKVLSELVKKSSGRIIVIPGGAVRLENVNEIINKTSCIEIHTAALNSKTGKLDVEELKQIKKLILK